MGAVTVLDNDAQKVEVHPERLRCSCDERGCAHLRWVLAVKGGDKGAAYESISAMHKEIRRGDARRVMFWHKMLVATRGEGYAKSYVKNIILEETRNLALVHKFRRSSELDSEEMTRDLVCSRKKWELQTMAGLYPIVVKADVKAHAMPPIEAEELTIIPPENELQFFNWLVLVARVFHYLRNLTGSRQTVLKKRMLGMLADSLAKRLRADGMEEEAELVETKLDFHPLMLGVEAACGLKDSHANDVYAVAENPFDVDLLMPPVYAYDAHTARGRFLLQKHTVRAGERAPPTLDLRWSGQILGIWWRYAAFTEHGMNYRRKRWHAVTADEKLWGKLVKSDRIWRGLKV